MALTKVQIFENLSYRSKLRFWRILSYILILSLIFTFSYDFKNSKLVKTPHIAKIDIEGIILEDHIRDEKIRKLAEDPKVEAVIMHVNSPGGSLVGAEDIYEAISFVKKQKPVAVTMGTMATSAGYYISLAGDRIFARNGTLTGSIGVILQSFEVTELAKNLGIELVNFKSSKYKAMPNPFEKIDSDVEKQIKETIDENYDIFYKIVKKRRKINASNLNELANGRVFSGREAAKHKLIDAIGGQIDAKNWLVKNKKLKSDIKVVNHQLKQKKPFIEKIIGSINFTNNSLLDKINKVGLFSYFG